MKYDFVCERTGPESVIRTPGDILPVLEKFSRKKQEHFLVLSLSGNHTLQRLSIVSIGLANRTLVHPREVFMPAIKEGAVTVIVAHNHPSGSCSPSQEDIDTTRRLVQAGDILGIPVLDHIIFSGKGRYTSFQETGNMPISTTRNY